MVTKTEEILEKTDLKTLWSDTLYEMLYDALENDWSNNALEQILKQLKNKGLKPEKVLHKVEELYGKDMALKLYNKLKKQAD